MLDKVILFADSARGIYIPQHFVETLDLNACSVEGINESDLETLADGPDAADYWDVWDFVLDNCIVVYNETGQRFGLYQDGDLWLIEETAKPGIDHDLFESL